MKPEEKPTNYLREISLNGVINDVNLKKVYIPSYNRELLRKATTTRIDLEKMNYYSELIWKNEKANPEDQEVFKRKKISVFRFFIIFYLNVLM